MIIFGFSHYFTRGHALLPLTDTEQPSVGIKGRPAQPSQRGKTRVRSSGGKCRRLPGAAEATSAAASTQTGGQEAIGGQQVTCASRKY